MIVNGLFEPVKSACFGLWWTMSRFIYGAGYAHKGAKGRYIGAISSYLGYFPLMFMTFRRALLHL